jgi:aspartyl-tRNA(Asn)/glutamyl-tRNA(Gln) amidotransferase subunit B
MTDARLAEIRAKIGELPVTRRDRYVAQYALALADAALIAHDESLAAWFDAAVGDRGDTKRAKTVANWLVNDVLGLQRSRALPAGSFPLSPGQVSDLIDLVDSSEITGRAAKELLPHLAYGEQVREAAVRLSLLSLDDAEAVRAAARTAISAFPAAVEDFRRGKTAAIGRLIGETIRITGGRANPDAVRAVLIEELTS